MFESLIPGLYDLLQDRDISKVCKAIQLMGEELERLHGEVERLKQQFPNFADSIANTQNELDSRLKAIEVVVASSKTESRKTAFPLEIIADARQAVSAAAQQNVSEIQLQKEKGEAEAARFEELEAVPETQRVRVVCRNCGKQYTNTRAKVQKFPACQMCGARPFDFQIVTRNAAAS